nr:hypothetical protein [Streptomyces sp. Alain-F2R5]
MTMPTSAKVHGADHRLVGPVVLAGEKHTRAVQCVQTGPMVTRQGVALGLALCGEPSDSRGQGPALCTTRQGDRLLGVVPVQGDEGPADQRVTRQRPVAASGRQIDRALRPPQGRPLVPGLLHQPADVFGVP